MNSSREVQREREHDWRPLLIVFLALACCSTSALAESRRLTTDGRLKNSPVFADRSGEEILFVIQDRANQFRLMRLKLADLSIIPVHPNETKTEFEPALSADGQVLSYVQNRGNLSLALVIHDARSGKDAEIPPAGGFSGPRSPVISPDGTRVLFSFADQGRQQIQSVNIQAAERKTIIDSDGVNNWPDFSPDGRRIVFASTRDDDYEIYSATSEGTDLRRLTASLRQDIRPRYSPDGSRIAFMSNRDGNYEIYLMQTDGTGVVRVTDNPESDDYPAWHPDGKRLVVVSERDGKHDLYLIDVP